MYCDDHYHLGAFRSYKVLCQHLTKDPFHRGKGTQFIIQKRHDGSPMAKQVVVHSAL